MTKIGDLTLPIAYKVTVVHVGTFCLLSLQEMVVKWSYVCEIVQNVVVFNKPRHCFLIDCEELIICDLLRYLFLRFN